MKCLTNVTRGDFNHIIRLIAKNDGVAVRIHGRPPSEENGIFEHGWDPLLPEPPLLVEEKGGGHGGALGVSNDGIERTLFLHDLEQVFERIIGAAVGRCDALAHQLSHCVLGRLAVGEVPNSRQDIVLFGLVHALVRLNEAEIWWLTKVFLEPVGRDGLAGPVDEVKGGSPIFSQFFDQRCFTYWLGHDQK